MHPGGVFLIKFDGGLIDRSEIIKHLGGIKYIAVPYGDRGVQAVLYEVNGRGVYFEFDSRS